MSIFDAYTEKGIRIIPALLTVGVFGDDWRTAWDHYRQLNERARDREDYVVRTDRVERSIEVIVAFGRKLKQA